MSKPLGFEKPIGVRDYMPHIVRRLRTIQTEVLACMERWGYEEIMTPTFEYYDTVGAASAIAENKMFKLLDPKGKTLVLRTDMTAPIARVVASLLKEQSLPIRLSYHANVFRAPEEEAGRDAEFFQTGVELIGDPSTDADAEVVALACASLEAAGLEKFSIALGHSGFLVGMMESLLGDREEVSELKKFLLNRNHVGYVQLLRRMNLSSEVEAELINALHMRGGPEVLERVTGLTQSNKANQAIDQLRSLYATLAAYGVSERVMIDLTMLGDFSYYTGITFEGYAFNQAFPVCSGGRYDTLLRQFGRSAPATGFALKTNRILELLGKQQTDDTDRQSEGRVLILYDDSHRLEAIRFAKSLRTKQGLIVETGFLESSIVPYIAPVGQHEGFQYHGKYYEDVITFVNVSE